jgi:hypothetical protein
MHVVTHLLCGWAVAETASVFKPLAARDRALVAWACVAPDVDGAGLLVDWANRILGRVGTDYYETWHHVLGHGGAAGLLVTLSAACLARDRWRTAALALLSFHLHLLGDLAGSRGSSALDIWTIPYLAPFAMQPALSWDGQWPLTGWQNTSLTVVLMGLALTLAVRRGYSPVSLISVRADRTFVGALRQRFTQSAKGP